jgi:hypothetical protein
MDKQFKLTALLVVEHNITGMKYFCKTTMLDRVHRYKGSGIYWTKHLREHGFDVKVGMLGFYVEKQRCLDAAKKFSEENNIVESKEWANSIIETGMNGAILEGERNPFYGKTHTPEAIEAIRLKNTGKHYNKGAYRSPEHRAKLSAALMGRKNPDVAEKLRGRKLTDEHRANIGKGGKGRQFSVEAREKLRQAALAQWARKRAPQIQLPAEENQ